MRVRAVLLDGLLVAPVDFAERPRLLCHHALHVGALAERGRIVDALAVLGLQQLDRGQLAASVLQPVGDVDGGIETQEQPASIGRGLRRAATLAGELHGDHFPVHVVEDMPEQP
jgi:hypothetical protein